jgi:hypothetical protein
MTFPPRSVRSEESWSSALSPNSSTPFDATLLGMPVRTGRWVFVLAGMLMNVCLGAVYAWSVFRTPVAKLFS